MAQSMQSCWNLVLALLLSFCFDSPAAAVTCYGECQAGGSSYSTYCAIGGGNLGMETCQTNCVVVTGNIDGQPVIYFGCVGTGVPSGCSSDATFTIPDFHDTISNVCITQCSTYLCNTPATSCTCPAPATSPPGNAPAPAPGNPAPAPAPWNSAVKLQKPSILLSIITLFSVIKKIRY